VFVCGVIVQDQVHRQILGYFAVDGTQEREEFLMAMPQAGTDRSPYL